MKKQIQKSDPVISGFCVLLLILCIASLFQQWFLYVIFLCGIVCSLYLYVSAEKQTALEKGSRKIDVYRRLLALTIFLLVMFALISLLGYVLPQYEKIAQDMRYFLVMFFMVIFGNEAPRLPYNQTLGLRISWTLDDEATWRYAHRVLGYCAFPCVIGMLACYFLGYASLGFVFLLLYFLIPSILSYGFYRKSGWVLTNTRASYRSIWIIPGMHALLMIFLYSYLPNDFPMQFSNHGTINYTWPKPIALALMLGVEVAMIFYTRGGNVKRMWLVLTMLFLAFMVTTIYILLL